MASLAPRYGICVLCGEKVFSKGAHAEACTGRPRALSEGEWPSPAGPSGLVKAGKTDAKSTAKIGTSSSPSESAHPGPLVFMGFQCERLSCLATSQHGGQCSCGGRRRAIYGRRAR